MRENDNNSGSVKIQTENSSSKSLLEQKIESLGKEVKLLRKKNQVNSGIIGFGVIGLVGYIIVTNWSAIAPALVAAGTAIAAAAPVIGITVGAIIGVAVLVGASYAIWKYRAQIKAGFKYTTERTVKGAEELCRKAEGIALRARYAVKKGAKNAANHLGDSLKEFAHSGERPMESPLVQELLEQKEIKSEINELTKIIKEDSSSIRIKTLSDKEQSSLKKILTKGLLDMKDLQFIINIVSEHHNEIKEVIKEYKENNLYLGVSNMFNTAEKKANCPSFKGLIRSLPSFPSLGRKSLTKSEECEIKEPFSFNLEVNEGDTTSKTATVGKMCSGKQPVTVVPLKVSERLSNDYDIRSSSLNSSGSFTPKVEQRLFLSNEVDKELTEKFVEQRTKIGLVDLEAIGQKATINSQIVQ